MKFLDEYRDAATAKALLRRIRKETTRSWNLMEVCGGQTHGILRFGLDQLLPDSITLHHGPGCPVCVTPLEAIDQAFDIARRPEVIFCSFGDMLRVPGSREDLLAVRAAGGDVRVVYSPLDALAVARSNRDRQVVFFAVGFETTAPANATAVQQASREGLDNFSVLVSHVRVPPAMEAILTAPDNCVEAFLAAGHVCTVMGYEEYFPIAERYSVPIVVAGFEPVDLLHGILLAVQELEAGRHGVLNAYSRIVRREGLREAQALLEEVFEIADRSWRGIGFMAQGGLSLRPAYRAFDALERFELGDLAVAGCERCKSGEVLRGALRPDECPEFARTCTPDGPLGATMVSSEGACAAYYRYRRLKPCPVPP